MQTAQTKKSTTKMSWKNMPSKSPEKNLYISLSKGPLIIYLPPPPLK